MGGILVRSVGNRPAQPALTYAPVTRLRPCCLFRATANTPETLSHAGAFARHRGQDKAARDAAHGQDPAIDASTGLVQAAPTPAPVRLTSPALAEGRHFSLVSWPRPTPPAFDLRILKFAPVSCSPLRPSPTHQNHCLALARSPGNGPPRIVNHWLRSGAGMRDRALANGQKQEGGHLPSPLLTHLTHNGHYIQSRPSAGVPQGALRSDGAPRLLFPAGRFIEI